MCNASVNPTHKRIASLCPFRIDVCVCVCVYHFSFNISKMTSNIKKINKCPFFSMNVPPKHYVKYYKSMKISIYSPLIHLNIIKDISLV